MGTWYRVPGTWYYCVVSVRLTGHSDTDGKHIQSWYKVHTINSSYECSTGRNPESICMTHLMCVEIGQHAHHKIYSYQENACVKIVHEFVRLTWYVYVVLNALCTGMHSVM